MVIVALTNVIYKCIFVSLGHATWEIVSMYNRPKLRYNESRYSEFRDIVNKCQLPLLLTKSQYSKFRDIVNKRGLIRSFIISKFGCIEKLFVMIFLS